MGAGADTGERSSHVGPSTDGAGGFLPGRAVGQLARVRPELPPEPRPFGGPIRPKEPGPREGSRQQPHAGFQRRAIPVRWRNGFAQKQDDFRLTDALPNSCPGAP
jgi:hypothetical protein